jgi:hypothetical protein
MRKLIAGAVAAASMVGGSLAVAAVNPMNIAGAQSPGTTVPPATAPPSSTPPNGAPGKGGFGHRGGPDGGLKSVLDGMVKDGTITQAQEDAILQRVAAEAPKGGRGFGFGFGLFGPGQKDVLDAVAADLHLDTQTLLNDLRNGQSLADIAKTQNVPIETVINTIVTKETAAIDQAVTDKKLTQAQADKIKNGLTQHVTDLVNGTFKGFGHRGGGFGGPGGPGAPGQGPSTAPATPNSPPGTGPGGEPSTTTTAPPATAPMTPGTTTH